MHLHFEYQTSRVVGNGPYQGHSTYGVEERFGRRIVWEIIARKAAAEGGAFERLIAPLSG